MGISNECSGWHVCCCCSPSESYGRKGGDSNLKFSAELPVRTQAAGVVGTQAAGVVGTLNCGGVFSLYNSGILSTTVSIWTLSMLYYFDKVYFSMCTFPLFGKYTLHVCYVFYVIDRFFWWQMVSMPFRSNDWTAPHTLIPGIFN